MRTQHAVLAPYPVGGLATDPEAIREAYRKLKEDRQRVWRGERPYYAWEWDLRPEAEPRNRVQADGRR